jgi:copper chaperone CopZ
MATQTAERTAGYENFVVHGIHCETCAGTLQETLASIPGVRGVQVEPTMGWTHLRFDPDVVTGDELVSAVEAGGYEIVRTWD